MLLKIIRDGCKPYSLTLTEALMAGSVNGASLGRPWEPYCCRV